MHYLLHIASYHGLKVVFLSIQEIDIHPQPEDPLD